jgi:hemoglobin
MTATLYEKYGGFKVVSRVVMRFYEMALDSDQIGDYFEDIDMPRLMDHQTKFISSLLGGPVSFSNDRLHQVHSRLEISHVDFDELVNLLGEALAEYGFSSSDINIVLSEIELKRALIVARNSK